MGCTYGLSSPVLGLSQPLATRKFWSMTIRSLAYPNIPVGCLRESTFRRAVRKGRVRSIFEIKGGKGVLRGVGISERTQFGGRMWGFVFVSTSLPEFESLRQLAESW